MTDYLRIYTDHLKRLGVLIDHKRDVEAEIEKTKQMLKACYNMVPDEEKKSFSAGFRLLAQVLEFREKGLTEAIRNILQSNAKKYFSPIEVRDRLQESGFDFAMYASNPLSSVHSVLKRFKRTEVKTREVLDGTKQYRWISRFPRLNTSELFSGPPPISLKSLAEKIEAEKGK